MTVEDDDDRGRVALDALLAAVHPDLAALGTADLEFPAQITACAGAIMQVCPSLRPCHGDVWGITADAVALFKAAAVWQELQPAEDAPPRPGGAKMAEAATKLQAAVAAYRKTHSAASEDVLARLPAHLLSQFQQAALEAEAGLQSHKQGVLKQATETLAQAVEELRLVACGMADGTSWREGVPNDPGEETWDILQGKLQKAPIIQKAHAKTMGTRHTAVVKAPHLAPHRRLPSLQACGLRIATCHIAAGVAEQQRQSGPPWPNYGYA